MSRIGDFLRDDRAAATIEFILWIPVIMALLAIVIDATMIYVTHADMWNAARDTARRMVTGALMSEADAEAFAAQAVSLREGPYYVDANYDLNANAAQVIIAIRVSDISISGVGSWLYQAMTLSGTDMIAHVVMRPNPNIPFGTGGGGTGGGGTGGGGTGGGGSGGSGGGGGGGGGGKGGGPPK